MKSGYFQRVEVKIQLKEGLIIQKYSCLIIAKAKVTRLIGNDKVLFFVAAKAQKKLRSRYFQFGHSDIALLPRVPYKKDCKNGFEPTIAFRVLSFIVCQVLNNEYVQKHNPESSKFPYLFRTMLGFFSRRFWYVE